MLSYFVEGITSIPRTSVTQTRSVAQPRAPRLYNGERMNSEFERHHRSAEETGSPDPSPGLQRALETVRKRNQNTDPQDVIFLHGATLEELEAQVHSAAPAALEAPEKTDPYELG
jgi:hypothetical protein